MAMRRPLHTKLPSPLGDHSSAKSSKIPNGSPDCPSDAEKVPASSNQTILLLYFMGFIDLFGVSMMIPLIPKLAHSLGASRSMAGIIGSIYGAIQIFSSPVVGKLGDDRGRRNVLLLVYLGSCLGYFILSCSTSVTMLVFSRIPNGLLKHGLSISKAYIVDISTPEQRPSMLGYFNAISSAGFIVGPLLSGYLADLDPTFHLSLLTGASVYALNFALVLLVLPQSKKDLKTSRETESRSFLWFIHLKQVSKALGSFRGFQWWRLKGIISVRFLAMMAVMVFRYNFSIFTEESFSISNTDLGKLTSFTGVTAVFASATCGAVSKRYSDFSKHPIPGLMLLSFSLICTTLSRTVPHILLSLLLLSLSTAYLRVCLMNVMLDRGRPEERGAILGFTYSLSSICRMLTPSLVGVVQELGSRTCVHLAVMLSLSALVGMSCI